jgi:hypothetical protein
MWKARTKIDLIIEVWEKLDCENVGAAEIEAITTVIANEYGNSAVDSPMVIARMLADEGAHLRHSEIMELYLKRSAERPYDAAFRNIIKLDDLKAALASIRGLENLRQKYRSEDNRQGLRLVRETAIEAKQTAVEAAEAKNANSVTAITNTEIAQWFAVWLQTPEVFESWVALRQRSAEFVDRFGQIAES